MTVAIAAPNDHAAEAGARIARQGGNATDAAIASMITAMVTEPGICSLAGGAYLAVGTGAGVEVIDANCAMPGRGLDHVPRGSGVFELHTDYGGGVTMWAGHGSVAVPGTPMGIALAHQRHGQLPWRLVWEPAIEIARAGFELGAASRYYMQFVHSTLYGWHPESNRVLHHADGRLRDDELVVVPGLADTLEQFAHLGVEALTAGDLGARIVQEVRAGDGLLTMADLRDYEPIVRTPLTTSLPTAAGTWRVATNPPPAIGGVTLSAMLQLLVAAGDVPGDWDADVLARIVRIQDAVLARRITDLDAARDRETAGLALLAAMDDQEVRAGLGSPSTLHVSAVDDDGRSCAITASTGYGSGVMPEGTGLWLNNCLGEVELNPHGLHRWDVGDRLPSNMAPSVATGPAGEVVAIGSPGADRITTALLQVLGRLMGGATLREAVDAPRLHTRHDDDGALDRVAHEASLDLASAYSGRLEPMHDRSMYFGGVGVAMLAADGRLEAASDPRRDGGTRIVEARIER